MKIDEIIRRLKQEYPDLDTFECATNDMIESCEQEIGFLLPLSFHYFLQNYSNGIFLFDSEPIAGTSSDSPCGKICKVGEILPDLPEKVFITDTKEWVASSSLVSFTTYDAGDVSNNHWVFICDQYMPSNNYRVGFITQDSKTIVKSLADFEEWLTILFEHNKSENSHPTPVFHALYPTFDERMRVLYPNE